jgi:wyosine [tRNA(Phe)-imidazoG37] synthetase (radical SAM superfamily)
MTLPLKRGITYGPVQSRRLGRSLGVNILPKGRKICTFNCVYCQYGWTPYTSLEQMKDAVWPSPELVFGEVGRTLAELSPPPAYITFSGNGEPTMHPRFGEIVEGVIDLRNRLSPGSKTAILSNSTLLGNEKIRRAIEKLDVKILKLDAGIAEVYQAYNRPLCATTVDELVAALKSMKGPTIQALFTTGISGNSESRHVDAWVRRIVEISPLCVQLYTLDRPYPSKNIAPASRVVLEGIRARLEERRVHSEVF